MPSIEPFGVWGGNYSLVINLKISTMTNRDGIAYIRGTRTYEEAQ